MGRARVVEEAEVGAIGEQGEAADHVIGALTELKRQNVPTYGPRMFRPSYFAGEDVVQVGRGGVSRHFIKENWLYGRTSYPAVGMFEDEVLASVLDLFHAPREAGGVLTSGGTESLILSVKVARDHAREAGRASPLNMVIPHTGHPAFEKAGDLLEVEVKRAPSSVNWGADVEWMRQACDARTALLVGSAPPYPFGQVDPIADLAALAAEEEGDLAARGRLPWRDGAAFRRRCRQDGTALRLPDPGSPVDLGRPAQVRLCREGHLGPAAPGPGQQRACEDRVRQLAGRPLRHARHLRLTLGRCPGLGLGGDALSRPCRIRAAHEANPGQPRCLSSASSRLAAQSWGAPTPFTSTSRSQAWTAWRSPRP